MELSLDVMCVGNSLLTWPWVVDSIVLSQTAPKTLRWRSDEKKLEHSTDLAGNAAVWGVIICWYIKGRN